VSIMTMDDLKREMNQGRCKNTRHS
jgi:hypothetical protein